MTARTLDRLLSDVLPAAADYDEAERELTEAYSADNAAAAWEAAARKAKRRAAELAIAIDGLTDRLAEEAGLSKTAIRTGVTAHCVWPGTAVARAGAHDRVRGVANAYKHRTLTDRTLPIASEDDILVVGLGFGLDGWGVGKFSGVEVLVQERDPMQTRYKFLGDAPTAIAAWFKFLAAQGATIPAGTFNVFGLQVHP